MASHDDELDAIFAVQGSEAVGESNDIDSAADHALDDVFGLLDGGVELPAATPGPPPPPATIILADTTASLPPVSSTEATRVGATGAPETAGSSNGGTVVSQPSLAGNEAAPAAAIATGPVIIATINPPADRSRRVRGTARQPADEYLERWLAVDTDALDAALNASPAAVIDACTRHGSVPLGRRAAVWPTLLGLGDEADATGGDVAAPAIATTPLSGPAVEAMKKDVAAVYRTLESAEAKAGGCALAVPQDAAVALLSDVCASTCGGRYSPYSARLLGILLCAGFTATASRVALPKLIARFAPSLLPAAVVATGLSLDLDSRLATLHEHLRTLVLYHDATLVAGLDAICPGWHLPAKASAGGVSGGAFVEAVGVEGASVQATGCIPSYWLGAAFAGPLHLSLPLWDRLLLWAAAPEHRAPAVCDIHAVTPCNDVSYALLLAAATLLLRESPSLKVICTTHGRGADGATDAAAASTGRSTDGAASAPPSVLRRTGTASSGAMQQSGRGAASVSYLITLTLEGAIKRCLSAATPQIGDERSTPALAADSASAADDVAVENTASWLAAAAALASATPPSFGTFLRTNTTPIVTTGALSAAAPPLQLSPACADVIRVPPRPVAAQLVYGWKRIHDAAVIAAAETGGAAKTPAGEETEPAIALLPSSKLGGVSNTTLHPVRFLVVDVRPITHRLFGRFATAYHIDPRTLSSKGAPQSASDPLNAAAVTIDAAVPPLPKSDAVAAGAAADLLDDGDSTASASAAVAADVQAVEPSQVAANVPLASVPSGAADPGADGDDDALDANTLTARAIESSHASASSAIGLPLDQAVRELVALSGALHFAVIGVGVQHMSGAYTSEATLAASDEQDGVRVAAVVRAFVGAGIKYVSVVDGGYAALHAVVRDGTMPAVLAGSSDDVAYLHRSALVDHRPRGCPACRHVTITSRGGKGAPLPSLLRLLRADDGEPQPVVQSSVAARALTSLFEIAERALGSGPSDAVVGPGSQSTWGDDEDADAAAQDEVERRERRLAAIQSELDKWSTVRSEAVAAASVRAAAAMDVVGRGAEVLRRSLQPPPSSVDVVMTRPSASAGAAEPATQRGAASASGGSNSVGAVLALARAAGSAVLSAGKEALAPPTIGSGGASAGTADAASHQATAPNCNAESAAAPTAVNTPAQGGTPTSTSTWASSMREAATTRLREASRVAEMAARAIAAPPSTAVTNAGPRTATVSVSSNATVATDKATSSTPSTAPAPTETGGAVQTMAKSAIGITAFGLAGLRARVAALATTSAPAPSSANPRAGTKGLTLGEAVDRPRKSRGITLGEAVDRPRRPAAPKPVPSAAVRAGTDSGNGGGETRAAAVIRHHELAGLTRGAVFTLDVWTASGDVTIFRCEKEKHDGTRGAAANASAESDTGEGVPVPHQKTEHELKVDSVSAADSTASAATRDEGVTTSTLEEAAVSAAGVTAVDATGTDTSVAAVLTAASTETPTLIPRYLCIGYDRLLVLAAHPTELGLAEVKSNHHVSEIAKLTFSRRHPLRLTLSYRRGGGDAATIVRRTYHVERAAEFKNALAAAIAAAG